ncbi:outer membrane beta-barrel family protein [Flavobacterium sp. N1994]|uniref:outer membrane beta-barrel family protein n=1 Tax=Flavobacterium sp. N1994 TaxID=2986827 RepID=UPI0022234601|nr:outer membrane beta-barrel family protein [Flavobacterium sp. N1994]
MRFKISLLFFFCTLSLLQAQNSTSSTGNVGSISGKVIDKNTKQPIPYVNISIKQANKIITGGITQDNGNFTIKNLALETYTAEILFIGYKKVVLTVSLTTTSKSINLNTMSLEEEAVQLEGVEIVKEKSTYEQKIDRKIINVGKDLISAGATAGEILNNIPSVSVDAQTNAISLRGNENVRVLIDGKPTNIDPAQLLKQIPSASIKQIELITNPSAKYNPEGMSGIINIVLHKNANQGFNASINNGVTFAKTPKVNSSFDMNYKVGKFNFYTNYGFNHGLQKNHGFVNSHQPNAEKTVAFDFGNKNTSHLYKIGVDYYLDDNNTLSIYTNQNIYLSSGNSITSVNYQDNLISDIAQTNESRNDNPSGTYNLDFKHKFKKEGENIELEANYNRNKGTEDSHFTTIAGANVSDYYNYITNVNNNTKINLDYTNPLPKDAKLEVGLETRIETTNNNFNKDFVYNSDFKYERQIHSAYVTYGKQWTKWGYQLGARFENYTADANFHAVDANDENGNGNTTEIIAKTFNDKINTVYPSGYLSYKLSDKNTFNFNYSRRVDRPSIGQVNPIREWSTPTVTSIGNPYLKPQFTNSFELNYTRKTKIGSISSVIFYRMISQEITRLVEIDPNDPNRNILSYDNFKDNNSYGAEISANLDFTKWWSANIGTDIYFKTIRGTVSNQFVEKDVSIFNGRINNTFKATKNLRFQLFGMYRGQEQGLQFLRKSMYKTDLGASYNILKGQGTISARASDIFNTMNFSFDGTLPYKQEGAFYWESQSVYLGFSYRFGGGKNAALQRKQRDKNETQGGGGMM